MGSDGRGNNASRLQETVTMASAVCTPVESSLAVPAGTLRPEASTASVSTGKQGFLEGLKYGAAGGVAGAFAKSCTAPLARLTILYQVQGFTSSAAGQPVAVQQPPGLRHAFMQVVKQEGPAALWKGNLATILHRLPYSSINFYTYEHTNRFLVKQLPPNTDFARSLLSGALAGLVACTAAYPLDLVRTRLAAQTQGHYYHGILPTLQRIVADEGTVGLYRGLGATLLQVVPSLALSFSLYDTIRDSCMAIHIKQQQHLQPSHQQPGPSHPIAVCGSQTSDGSSSNNSHIDSSSTHQQRRRSFLGTPSDPQELAHSLSVASSVDQGTSLAQAAIWHMADQDARVASSTPLQQNAAAGSSCVSTAAGISDCSTTDITSTSTSTSSSSSSRSRAGVGHTEVPAGISLASGCMSGFVTATVTFPLDVIRRRMQVYGREHHAEPVSYRQIIQQISRHRGLRGFYVGILPEYCKVVPGVAIAFCTYEQMKQWLQAE